MQGATTRVVSKIKRITLFLLVSVFFLGMITAPSHPRVFADNQPQIQSVERGVAAVPVEGFPADMNRVFYAIGNETLLVGNDNGEVYGYGRNNCGVFGDPNSVGENVYDATKIEGIGDVIQLKMSRSSSVAVALKADGTVWTWGCNELLGRVHPGSSGYDYVPAQITSLSGITKIDVAEEHVLALSNTGTIFAWGRGQCGQLGTEAQVMTPCTGLEPESEYRLDLPEQVLSITDAVDIAISPTASYALLSDGTVWEWGDRYTVEGFGSVFPAHTIPVEIAGLSNVTKIDAGQGNGFALTQSGDVYGWGVELFGTLGGNSSSLPKKDGQFYTVDPLLMDSLHGVTDISVGDWTLVSKSTSGLTTQGGGYNVCAVCGDCNSYCFDKADAYESVLLPYTDGINSYWGADSGHLVYFYSGVQPSSGERIFMNEDGILASISPYNQNYQSYDSSFINGFHLSPDGSKILYIDQSSGEIISANVDGSSPSQLTSSSLMYEDAPRWSPDGSKVLFTAHDDGTGLTSVYVMQDDGSDITLVVENAGRASWSPDGQRIVFESYPGEGSQQIGTANINGSNINLFGQTNEDWAAPQWSPDGSRFVWVASRNDLEEFNSSSISTMNTDGTGRFDIFVSSENVEISTPMWSPDSSIISFTAAVERPNGTSLKLQLIPAIGGIASTLRYGPHSLLQWWAPSDEEPGGSQVSTLNSSADTYLRSGQSNRNHGADTEMRIQSAGDNRSLLRISQDELGDAIGNGNVISAKLRLTITDNADNWGSEGRTIDLHRLLTNWTEGNGTENERGDGEGATWVCAIDSLIENQAKNCSGSTEWQMGQPNNPAVHPWFETPTATQTITNGQSGAVEFDVTADIIAFLNGETDNFGWIIKKTNEGQNGQVSFGTRESSFAPELVITYQP